MFGFKPGSKATFVEVYGRSIFDQSQLQRRNLSVQGLGALDLRTNKPSGEAWNFLLRADRREAQELVNKLRPDWILGAPPCTAFSIWNHGINYKRMSKDKVEKLISDGLVHLKFMCRLYKSQIEQGRYFLHEHPASALSWKVREMEILVAHPLVNSVVGDQCMYGLLTPSEFDRTSMVPAKKSTRFMSNSSVMLDELRTRCDKSHDYQPTHWRQVC